ncbi:hypothetical protein V8F20_006890 [Naviculisporaceae sp. PSN 640]
MSPKLKPLLLPQMVEDKRKLELLQQLQQQQLQQQYPYAPSDADPSFMYSSYTSSSSDLPSPSPATSTFSRSHLRYSGSSSSLELITSPILEVPASPAPPAHPSKNMSHLPDVQEDPSEREEGTTMVADREVAEFGLYDCLCDEPCTHHTDLAQSPSAYPCTVSDIDFDFMLDYDPPSSPRQKKRRNGSDASFSNWGTRLGSKLSSLPRWGSTSRRQHFAFSPASDPSLDQQPVFSRTASSRSSSISVPSRMVPDRTIEPPMPATPALSFYGSTESVNLPPPTDNTQITVGKSLERDRALATTPLLPPLLTESVAPQAHASPLQSPSIAPSQIHEVGAQQTYPTPPLSTKASVSSIRRGTIASPVDIPSPIPCFPDQQDAWSDRLGHANFIIEPKPYVPESADLESLHTFLNDWDLARINYTKHLVRTGEHYGTTSKTYNLTEEKWAEIEQQWRNAEEDLRNRLTPTGNGYALVNSHLRRTTQDMLPAAIPRMLSDDAKFPHRGDVDIVGPMVRDAVMVRDLHDEKKNSASTWLRNIAGKVGLRK